MSSFCFLTGDRGHALGVTPRDNTWEWRDVWIMAGGQRDKAHGALHDLENYRTIFSFQLYRYVYSKRIQMCKVNW